MTITSSTRRHRDIAAGALRDVERLAESFERAATRVRKQHATRGTNTLVTDPDAVHDLRVASRRLSAALRLWRPVLHKSARRDAARGLREIRRVFGPVRDIEVHLAQIDALGGADSEIAPATGAALAELSRRLRKRYPRARESALAELGAHRARSVAHDVQRAFAGIRHRLEDPRERAAVAERLKASRAGAQEAFGAARGSERADDDTFHRVRIAIKKWRYAAERDARASGRASASVQRLRELQSALGSAHDASTLDAELTRFVARSPARRTALAPVSARLREEAQRNIAAFLERSRALARPAVSSRKPSSRAVA